jgi:hypothetical protein
MAQPTESDYKTAQAGDAKVRQEFIDALDFGKDRKLIDRVKYVDRVDASKDYTGERTEKECLMSFMPFIQLNNSKGFCASSKNIYFYQGIFTEDFLFFMNSTYAHELHHARQLAEKINTFCLYNLFGGYFQTLAELPAWLNQTASQERFPLNHEDLDATTCTIECIEKHMQSKATELGRDWKKDLSRILCVSPNDDIVRARYSL